MHRAFMIAETLQMIFVYPEQKSLSRLARTCRLFHNAAIPILWSSLDSLIPLWKLLPSNVVRIERIEYSSGFSGSDGVVRARLRFDAL
jgi:hypothetical protein